MAHHRHQARHPSYALAPGNVTGIRNDVTDSCDCRWIFELISLALMAAVVQFAVQDAMQLGAQMSTTTIIIPNYNYANYIEEAIESVLRQDVRPTEVFVIDDASTDSTRRVLAPYENNVRIIYNERNLGIVENFKKAVSLTATDYVAFVGADNIAKPDFVKELSIALDQNPNAGVAYFDMEIFGPRARDLAEKVGALEIPGSSPPEFCWTFPNPSPDILVELERNNFINGSSMFRRDAYEAAGGYQQAAGPEDADLFLRMLRCGYDAVRVPKSLLRYRQHSVGQANTALLLNMVIEQQKKALNEAWAEIGRVSDWANSLHDALIDANRWARHLEGELENLKKNDMKARSSGMRDSPLDQEL